MAGTLRKSVVTVAAAAGIVAGLAGPASAYVEMPLQDVYLHSEYYIGLNGTGGSWDALANCNRDAADITNGAGAYVATCTRTAYGARLDVYQQT